MNRGFKLDQKSEVFRVTIWLPFLFWKRICEFRAVMTWDRPTAPSVSGGMTVWSSMSARKLGVAGGEGTVDGDVVADVGALSLVGASGEEEPTGAAGGRGRRRGIFWGSGTALPCFGT